MEKLNLYSKTDIEKTLSAIGVTSVKLKTNREYAELFEDPVYKSYSLALYDQVMAINILSKIGRDQLKEYEPEELLALLNKVRSKTKKRKAK